MATKDPNRDWESLSQEEVNARLDAMNTDGVPLMDIPADAGATPEQIAQLHAGASPQPQAGITSSVMTREEAQQKYDSQTDSDVLKEIRDILRDAARILEGWDVD